MPANFLKAIPLDPKTDGNAEPDLHFLCSKCKYISQEILSLYQVLRDLVEQEDWADDKVEDRVLGHHLDSEELRTAGESGCHLCTLIWDTLDAPARKMLRDYESELSADRSRKIRRPEQSYEVGICTSDTFDVEPSEGNIGLWLKLTDYPENENFQCILLDVLKLSMEDQDSATSPSLDPLCLNRNQPLEIHARHSRKTWKPIFDATVPVSTSSQHTLTQASNWIKTCIRDHPLCHHTTDLVFKAPTRLVHVGFSDGSEGLRLRNSPYDEDNVEYATLSHCWGKAKTLKLTESTHKRLKAGFDIALLPHTYRDAVQVTRQLGLQYIWIDSLCIFQDSTSDWEREASKMGDVYYNSVITIAATWGSDGEAGCFTQRNPLTLKPCRIGPASANSLFAMPNDKSLGTRIDQLREAAPLLTRGWVLQERWLSTRVLFFGPIETHWTCRKGEASESNPDLDQELLPLDDEETYLRQKAVRDSSSANENQFISVQETPMMLYFYQVWHSILTRYWNSHLTFPTDNLIAISGIIQRLSYSTGMTCLHGIWQPLIPFDLLWYHQTPVSDPVYTNTPTYSWAHILGGKLSVSHMLTYFASDESKGSWEREAKATLSDTGPEIWLRGPHFPLNELWSEIAERQRDISGSEMDRDACFLAMDTTRSDESLAAEANLRCIPILNANERISATGWRRSRAGLVVVKGTGEEKDYHKRIGYWQYCDFSKDEAKVYACEVSGPGKKIITLI